MAVKPLILIVLCMYIQLFACLFVAKYNRLFVSASGFDIIRFILQSIIFIYICLYNPYQNFLQRNI
jgi:predicted neutral ceramidase superfamily lipid hydrolase